MIFVFNPHLYYNIRNRIKFTYERWQYKRYKIKFIPNEYFFNRILNIKGYYIINIQLKDDSWIEDARLQVTYLPYSSKIRKGDIIYYDSNDIEDNQVKFISFCNKNFKHRYDKKIMDFNKNYKIR